MGTKLRHLSNPLIQRFIQGMSPTPLPWRIFRRMTPTLLPSRVFQGMSRRRLPLQLFQRMSATPLHLRFFQRIPSLRGGVTIHRKHREKRVVLPIFDSIAKVKALVLEPFC